MYFQYDPVVYWNQRKDPSSADEFYTNAHTSYIRKFLKPTDFVLDFGPGKGRTFSAYYDNQRVVGVDISYRYCADVIDQARLKNLQYEHIITYKANRIPVFLREQVFDVAVFCEVLLHVPYAHIETLLAQAGDISKGLTIITWEAETTPQNLAPHCFNHNYRKLFEKLGMKVHDRTKFRQQTFYHVKTK